MTKITIIITAILFLSGCKFKSENNNVVSAPIELTGGYSSSGALTAQDSLLLESLVDSVRGFVDIEPISVATQIVAGTNYKFSCRAKSVDGAEVRGEIIIFQPLPHTNQSARVTKWKF